MPILKKFLYLLSSSDRKQSKLVLFTILIMALLDMFVGIYLPFMAALTNPELIQSNFALNKIFQISSIFGVENNEEFYFF